MSNFFDSCALPILNILIGTKSEIKQNVTLYFVNFHMPHFSTTQFKTSIFKQRFAFI